MTNKPTKKEMFAQIRAHLTDPVEIEFIDHQIALLEKKGAAAKKPTATQVANADIKDAIVAVMDPIEMYRISDLIRLVPALEGASGQKVSALMSQLVNAGVVVRTKHQRQTFFALKVEE